MTFPWSQMSVDEYAAMARALDGSGIRAGENYWRQVRPFFFRPLLPFHEYRPHSVQTPKLAALGGWQYGVASHEGTNSYLNLLLFRGVEDYSLSGLSAKKRSQVNRAAKRFSMRPIKDAAEFKRKAYPVYLSFYNRSRYAYLAERRYEDKFSQWADRLFSFSKITILGAYRNQVLEAVSISQWVGDTLLYSTFFCDDESLRLFVADLMLHWTRREVASCPQIKQIFAGLHKRQQGLNDFYLQRGCELIRQPALLKLSPFAGVFLKFCAPAQYRMLSGHFTGAGLAGQSTETESMQSRPLPSSETACS